MSPRSPEDVLRILEEQAAEDEAVEAMTRELAAMSDAELDAALRGESLDPEEVRAEALAVWRAVHTGDVLYGGRDVAVAVPQMRAREGAAPPVRRRPVSAVVWLAAAAVTLAGGAAVYTWLHTPAPSPPPELPPPAPPSVPAPAPSIEPENIATETPAQMRVHAAAIFQEGHPDACLVLLDRAKTQDPAGDKAPDIVKLRAQCADVGRKP